MRMRNTSFAFALTLLLGRQALADVAPPPNYEEQCTLEKKTNSTSECLECQSIREGVANSDRCPTLLSRYCFVEVCAAWGSVAYPTVWCRTKGATNPVVPDDVLSQLSVSSAVVPPSTSPANVTCLPYTPPPVDNSDESGGGCDTVPGSSASFGWAVVLLGLAWAAFFLLRRKTSAIRCKKDR
jgi:hypothetical protein